MIKERSTLTNEEIKDIEETIDYEFTNKGLLIQAFTRRSYGSEHKVPDNELLEFIGDSALNFIATMRLAEKSCELKEIVQVLDDYKDKFIFDEIKFTYDSFHIDANGNRIYRGKTNKNPEEAMTDARKAIVSKHTLSRCMDVLGLNEYLIMNKADIFNKVHETESTKEDLLESIIGAIAIDSKWNMETLKESVYSLLFGFLLRIGNEADDYQFAYINDDEISMVQEWYQEKFGKLPKYVYEKNSEGQYLCTIPVREKGFNFDATAGWFDSKKVARKYASVDFMNIVGISIANANYKEAGLKFLEQDFDGLKLDNAISMLQELEQKHKINPLTYEFDNRFDSNGNPVWRCTVKYNADDGLHERYVEPYVESKKAAKKNTALALANCFRLYAHYVEKGDLIDVPLETDDYEIHAKEYLYSGPHETFLVHREFVNGKEVSELFHIDLYRANKEQKSVDVKIGINDKK